MKHLKNGDQVEKAKLYAAHSSMLSIIFSHLSYCVTSWSQTVSHDDIQSSIYCFGQEANKITCVIFSDLLILIASINACIMRLLRC